MINASGWTVPAAAMAGAAFVRVQVDNAVLSVLENALTADRFVFEKNGTDVRVTGTNLGLLLQ